MPPPTHSDVADDVIVAAQPTGVEPTAPAPHCPPALAPVAASTRAVPTLASGQVIADYEILRLLGDGGFARVYLARQVSLNRLVALKVSANAGSEARTLARLEHQHIVQVFAELVLPEQNLRLLAIQFIPGVTLARVIQAQAGGDLSARTGRSFVAILDQQCTEPTPLDLSGLETRSFLETCDRVELTCWLGARLGEALAHAHSQGIIHRDIKPANILVNRYGRPFLADFNIAQDAANATGSIGGTLPYMAPEQLDAFLPAADRTRSSDDVRSDVYSLALVLLEFLTGRHPFAQGDVSGTTALVQLSRERHAAAPSARALDTTVPEVLDRLLACCLAPQPEQRLASAAAFMHALDGCRDLLQVEKTAGQQTWLVRACRVRPFGLLILLVLAPHLLGSVVNILYNDQLIANRDPAQQAAFIKLVLAYNGIAYPLLVLAGFLVIRRARRGWERLRTHGERDTAAAAVCRRRVLALPQWAVALSCLGWFPGGLVFPLGLHLTAGPLAAADFAHFLISFVLSGLIATTYAYFAAQLVVLRVLYPQAWSDPAGARAAMQVELRGIPVELRRYQFIAILIPLCGAVLLIAAGPDRLTVAFRALVTALIVLGLAGFAWATRMCVHLTHLVALLAGIAPPPSLGPQSRKATDAPSPAKDRLPKQPVPDGARRA